MMTKVKYLVIILLVSVVFTVLPAMSNAADTQVTTSDINGVTAKWEYELDESNQIINLKCTNPDELTGNVTVPSTLDGKSVISLDNEAFKSSAGITGIIIQDSIKEIGYSAFKNCTNLSSVDLGSIESISFDVFNGCTSLTEITIPKTLKNGAGSACLDNPNITKITLEEGLTVVPSYLCANTGITEIIIPSSVKEIEYDAFKDCEKLTKITILDNVTNIGFYNTSSSDSVFQNHNEDLTIYCYEGSMAANYAIKYDIKYVYLTKPTTDTPAQENPTNNNTPTNGNNNNGSTTGKTDPDDNTTAKGTLPYTGAGIGLIVSIIAIMGIGIFTYFKYNRLKGI